jgi:hypothetical protein
MMALEFYSVIDGVKVSEFVTVRDYIAGIDLSAEVLDNGENNMLLKLPDGSRIDIEPCGFSHGYVPDKEGNMIARYEIIGTTP